MKTGRIFWGLAFVLAAVCLIFNDSLFMGKLSIWTALISIGAIAVCIEGLFKLSFGKIIFGAAVLLLVWKEELGLYDLSNWDIIGAAVLLGIGLSLLFSPLKKHKKTCSHTHDTNQCNNLTGQKLKIERNFTGGVEYIRSNDFQRADIDVHFSGLKLYFDEAVISGDSATLHLDISFSGVEIYIPAEWAIDNRLDRVASGVEITKSNKNIAATKTLKLKGDISFGSLKIVYI